VSGIDEPSSGLRLTMVRPNLDDLPQPPLPEGFLLRDFRDGDEQAWIDIHIPSDRHHQFDLKCYRGEFGDDRDDIRRRQIFLCEAAGRPIGTVTAWFDAARGPAWGRIHWVAIEPPWQGRGLSKPMLAAACRRLRDLGHSRGVLTTQTVRPRAVGLYLRFGFVPEITCPADADAWRLVAARLRPDLTAAVSGHLEPAET